MYEEKTAGDVSEMGTEQEKVGFPGEHAAYRIFEVGCGVGNTVFPIIQTSKQVIAYSYNLTDFVVTMLYRFKSLTY